MRHNGLQVGIIGVLVIIIVFLMIAAPKAFLQPDIYGALMATVPYYGIIALPLTLLVIAQEIDLSFGSIMAMSVVGYLETYNFAVAHGLGSASALIALIACLLVGLLCGLLNGFIVVKIGIPSLIATIGTQFFYAGVALVITNAKGGSLIPTQQTAPLLYNLLVGKLFGFIPAQFLWMIVVGIAIWILLNRHRFGAHTYLIGDNATSARLMGINVNQRRVMMFALVGVASAFAGIVNSLGILYFYPTLGSGGFLLQTLAAVFLGGTPVLGGVGTILGTFVGCFIIGVIEPGTVAVNLTGFYTQLIYGLIIVVSVGMHTLVRRGARLPRVLRFGRRPSG
ncbi:MAG TPA: ABC transporter permease [Phototrophicaceae bacterium]|nr:ABC transporter permease [Phototrophicaceae bacterium]